MALPYYQVASDFIATKATMIAALLRVHRQRAVGMGADLIAYAVEATSTKEKPPDGILAHPDAPAIIEAAMQWEGEPGRAFEAFVSAGVVEKLPVGARVRGTDRYKATWVKNNRNKSGRKPALTRPGTGPEPARKKEMEKEMNPSSSKKEEEALAALPLPPQPEDRLADWRSFWVWWQHNRIRAGYPREKEPKADAARSFFAELMLEVNGSGDVIDEAIAAYAQDDYWKPKKLPFGGFMAQWRGFLPRRAR